MIIRNVQTGWKLGFNRTHTALRVNHGGGVIWVLSCDMEKSHGQLEILISPLSFGLAVMFPTQSGFRGRDSLLCLLTLIHSRAHTFTQTQQHAVTQDYQHSSQSHDKHTESDWRNLMKLTKTQIWQFRMKFKVKPARHFVSDHKDHKVKML